MTAADAAVRVNDVSRTFATGAGLHGVSFDAPDRTVTAVIGPNGAGKTVLFHIIAGLMPADSGHVWTRPGARIAYCPDVPQFEAWLTARELVRTARDLSPADASLTAEEALEQCGLSKVADRRVADFSRGMLQRLGIAAALVVDPHVLILDEPNSALDPIGRAEVRRLIAEQREQRCILLSSHLLSEVEQIADRVVVIADGKLMTAGPTAAVLAHGLPPAWNVRLSSPPAVGPDDLRREFPTATVDFLGDTVCAVRFATFEAAASDLVRLLHALRSPVLEVTLRDRDLDTSFARIIQSEVVR